MSCCSLNQTPHLKIKNNLLAQTANVQLTSVLMQIAVTQIKHYSVLISISYIMYTLVLVMPLS